MERCLAARRILYVWLDGGTRGRGGRASETGTTGVGGGGGIGLAAGGTLAAGGAGREGVLREGGHSGWRRRRRRWWWWWWWWWCEDDRGMLQSAVAICEERASSKSMAAAGKSNPPPPRRTDGRTESSGGSSSPIAIRSASVIVADTDRHAGRSGRHARCGARSRASSTAPAVRRPFNRPVRLAGCCDSCLARPSLRAGGANPGARGVVAVA